MESLQEVLNKKQPTVAQHADDKGIGFIIIPPTILWDERITLSEKVVYGRVYGFINKYGYCSASNEYLCEPLQISLSTFKNYLSRLYKLEHLRHEIIRDERGEIMERRIYSTTLVPQAVLPSHNPRTPEGTEEIIYRNNIQNNVSGKNEKKEETEVEYYARLLSDKLKDPTSLAYYKSKCRKYNCSTLLKKAADIIATPGIRNPGAVFVHWLQAEEKKLK